MILASGAALAQLYALSGPGHSASGTVFGVGTVGPLLIGFMTDAVGWRGVYALFALLGDSSAYRSGVSASGRKASRGHPTTRA